MQYRPTGNGQEAVTRSTPEIYFKGVPTYARILDANLHAQTGSDYQLVEGRTKEPFRQD